MSRNPHAIVVGAGVIGLTNAVFLAEAGYIVTVVAAHVPGDESIEYASPWAGAHWRTHASLSEPEQCNWDLQTYDYWFQLLADGESGQSCGATMQTGLAMRESDHYWDGEMHEDLWWAPHVRDYQQLDVFAEPISSINARGKEPRIRWAATSKAWAINVDRYLIYLQERARQSGAVIFRSRLPVDGGLGKALAAAEGIGQVIGRGKADIFVNSSGLGARKLCGDMAMFPIRGQTVLVKGEASKTRTRYHGATAGQTNAVSAYCIPRPGSGTTILGGTKEKDDWRETVDESTTKTILEKCSLLAPELLTGANGEFEVVSVQAGLRPGRNGGPRTELELFDGRKVVHAYGHAGAGYQNSVGAAKRVLELVNGCFGDLENDGNVSAKL